MQIDEATKIAAEAAKGGTTALLYILTLLAIAEGVVIGVLFRRLAGAWQMIAEKSERVAAALEQSNDLLTRQLTARGERP